MVKGSIQAVGLDQAGLLSDFSRLAYRATFEGTTSPENMEAYLEETYDVDRLSQELLDPNVAYYFYQVDGQVRGYLRLNTGEAQSEELHPNSLEIERIYIHPDYKGQGYGQDLMNFALEQAQELGKTAIWLGVWEKNKPALAFYQKNGFQKVGQHDFVMGDDVQTDYLYLKELD